MQNDCMCGHVPIAHDEKGCVYCETCERFRPKPNSWLGRNELEQKLDILEREIAYRDAHPLQGWAFFFGGSEMRVEEMRQKDRWVRLVLKEQFEPKGE